jgi:hypothetical protein
LKGTLCGLRGGGGAMKKNAFSRAQHAVNATGKISRHFLLRLFWRKTFLFFRVEKYSTISTKDATDNN